MRLLVQVHDRVGDVVRRHDVDAVVGTQWQQRKTRQKHKCAHHVELRGFRPAAVAQHDARAKNGARHVGKQLAHHVLAKFLGARVGIVIGTVPIDGAIFADHFVAAVPGHSHRADLAEPPQAVGIVRAAGQLHDLERAAKVDVQAALFGLAIERSRAMEDGIGRGHQRLRSPRRPGRIAAR